MTTHSNSFSNLGLDSRLEIAISDLGFCAPTPVQRDAIPAALTGRDVVGTARTGTGKTAAFVLPIADQLLRNQGGREPRALVLVPTRELALQVADAAGELLRRTSLRVTTVFGGVAAGPQEKALDRGVDILVACPGRLLDLLDRRHGLLDGIRHFVLDEADRMLDMGFLPDVKRVVKKLPVSRQTLLFSATFPREIESLAAQVLKDPCRVDLGTALPPRTIAHGLYPVPAHLKTRLLNHLLERADSGSVLVFTRTKHRANRVARQITGARGQVAVLHSNRSQKQREQALAGFREGRYSVLVATDIAARGLDIAAVSYVINYDIPDTPDAYIHRIGRTGRAEREGEAWTLVTEEDARQVKDIERALGKSLARQREANFDYAAPAAERTGFRLTAPRAALPRPTAVPAGPARREGPRRPARETAATSRPKDATPPSRSDSSARSGASARPASVARPPRGERRPAAARPKDGDRPRPASPPRLEAPARPASPPRHASPVRPASPPRPPRERHPAREQRPARERHPAREQHPARDRRPAPERRVTYVYAED